MRVLVIHNQYKDAGGEDTVFTLESELLRNAHIVETVSYRNGNGFLAALQFLFSIWNISSGIKIKKAIKVFKPEIIHIHNWHFEAGPLIIRVAAKFNVPIVVTLHNFRLLCPSGTLIYNNKLFLTSLSSAFPWAAIKSKVYRNSFLQTFWLVVVNWIHSKMGTWAMVSKYITLSNFAKGIFDENKIGINPDKIVVKQNFVSQSSLRVERRDMFLFVGRLSEEKGVNILLKAFSELKYKLTIVGTGGLKEVVTRHSNLYTNIKFLGQLKSENVMKEMAKCEALLFPSIWYEGMPMTILEAFASGTPVIASRIGTLAELITHGYNGLLFEPGSSEDLVDKVNYWTSLSAEAKRTLSRNAKQTYLDLYTPELNLTLLNRIYESVI